MNYTLRLFSSIKQGQGFVADITHIAEAWQRSTRLQGGYWQGSFQVKGNLSDLQDWFYNRLGYHVEERAGGQVSWEGMIYELTLTYAGMQRRRSLNDMFNTVRAQYSPYSSQYDKTPWTTSTQSIARYGRKENLLSLGSTNEASATAQCASALAENAWPWPRPVSYGSPSEATLDVRACGYVFAANWRYVSQVWGWQDQTLEGNISDWIQTIAQEDLSEFLIIGAWDTNTLQVLEYCETPIRCWDLFRDLTSLGDSSGNTWRLYVNTGRRLCYKQVDVVPRYYLRSGGIYNTAGGDVSLSPYTVRPGVMRDVVYPVGRAERGSALSDARDILVDEVSVDGSGQLSLRTIYASATDTLAAQISRQQRDRSVLDQYWQGAWERDLEKRRAEWVATHPIWEPFPY